MGIYIVYIRDSCIDLSCRYEIRTSVRVKVLTVLSSLLTSYGHWYEVRGSFNAVVLHCLNNRLPPTCLPKPLANTRLLRDSTATSHLWMSLVLQKLNTPDTQL